MRNFDLNPPKILKKNPYWRNIDIVGMEKLKDCKYVCESQVPTKDGGWSDFPVQIYWQRNPPKGYNDFFGFWLEGIKPQRAIICEIKPDFDFTVTALITPNDELIYSAFRHDMAWDNTNGYAIDGGRDYVKLSGDIRHCTLVKYNLSTDRISVIED